jgi:UDP-glucose 6-dehydrogenase
MLGNNWINPQHTSVPGTDNQLSYGGMCFPKDTNALLQFMIKNDSIHSILNATIDERNNTRNN